MFPYEKLPLYILFIRMSKDRDKNNFEMYRKNSFQSVVASRRAPARLLKQFTSKDTKGSLPVALLLGYFVINS